jgi:hypothetical protein
MFHVNDLALGLEAGDARDAPATVNVAGDATKCEDVRFPWAAGDPASVRRADIASATAALPASIVFDPDSVIGSSPFSECLGWPDAGNDPPRITQALPAVPALLISGAHDVRTPLADAAALAGQLPNATLLPVPDTGHSVLATDASGCARAAVGAFFAGTAIAQCPAEAPEPVDPLPPRSAAALAPAPPLAGTPGRVLRAVALTLRHDIGLGFEYIVAGNSGAGTAGGFVDVVGHGPNAHVVLRGLSYVPDVRLTGSLRLGSFRHAPGTLVIALGRNKHYGKITLSSGGSMAGTLGGRRFRLSWPARQAIDRAGGLAVLPSD